MASLLGKADPTLVTAAARAGLANVPGDYSKQFGIMADARKTLLEGVKKAWTTYEDKKKVDQKALDDGIKELRNYGVGIENNADYNMFSDEMDAQVAIWEQNKGFTNDSKSLREWERQNNKIMSKYKSNQVTMTEALEAWESSDAWKDGMTNGEFDAENVYQNDIGFLTNLVGYIKNVDDKSGSKNSKANSYMANNTGKDTDKKPEDLWKHLGGKDGEVVKYLDPVTNEFTYITSVDGGKVIAKKSSEISKMIPPREKDGETDIWTRVNSVRGLAKNKTHSYDDYNSALNQTALERIIDERQINNPRALEYLMDQKYGPMTESFAEALKKGTAITTPAIIASLEGLNMGYKDDGDSVLDAGDFKDPKNYDMMVQSILKDEKNYKLRRDLFVDHVDEMAFRPTWDNNKGTPKVAGNKRVITGKIDLGLSRYTNQRIYKNASEVEAVYNEVTRLGKKQFKGDYIVSGWDGARTYQYRKIQGSDLWHYQEWDEEKNQFITTKLNGKVQISTSDVIRDLNIPTTVRTKLTW